MGQTKHMFQCENQFPYRHTPSKGLLWGWRNNSLYVTSSVGRNREENLSTGGFFSKRENNHVKLAGAEDKLLTRIFISGETES